MYLVIVFVKDVLCYCIYASVRVGQLIVTLFEWTLGTVATILLKLYQVFNILVEDFVVFVHDLLLYFGHFGELVASIQCVIHNTYMILVTIVNGFFGFLTSSLGSIIQSIIDILWYFKKLLVMFGDGGWFLLVFVPKSLCNSIIHFTKALSDLTLTISTSVHRKVESLPRAIVYLITDIPIKTMIGLIFLLLCSYLFVQFHQTVLHHTVRTLVQLLNWSRRKLYKTWRLLHRKLVPKTTPAPVTASRDDFDRLCVICQEYSRCILILPCKHFCMCEMCSTAVRRHNNGDCPICRKRIRRTMKIFT